MGEIEIYFVLELKVIGMNIFKLKTDLLSKRHGNRFSPEASKRNTVLPTL